MVDYAFNPSGLNARRGAELTVHNEGQLAHNLTVERPGTSKKLAATSTFLPGKSEKLAIEVPAGHYNIVCTVPGHVSRGMRGTLRVE